VLAKRLEGISKKMLTQSLRNLEDWGVVERIVYDVVPPHVEYRLTTDGERFIEPLSLLHSWALENRDEIADVFQRRRDAKTATT
jgi:DNA-binding HxlR family transcriptional regulator